MADVTASNYGDYIVSDKPKPSTTYNATTTTPTGFLEFKPRDMETQKKYDAMSPTWEGVDSSMKAVQQGVYALDSAETTKYDARPQYAPSDKVPTPTESTNALGVLQTFVDSQPKPDGLAPSLGTCVIQ